MKTSARFLLLLAIVSLFSQRTFAQQYHYYFGNLHAHSGYSDGTSDSIKSHVRTPAQCFAYAKHSLHMDYLGISDHNHKGARMRLPNFIRGLREADLANEENRFVCLYGTEFGVLKNGGHVLIYNYNRLLGWDSLNYQTFAPRHYYKMLFSIVNDEKGAFATLAHPKNDDFDKLVRHPFSVSEDGKICGVAIASGPHLSALTNYPSIHKLGFYTYYKRLLSLGYHVGPTMDQDNHNTTFGRMSSSRTVVLAKKLNRDSIIDAYQNRRFYASTDWDTEVDFTIDSKPMGSRLVVEKDVDLVATVHDPGDPVASISIYRGIYASGIPARIYQTTIGDSHVKTMLNLDSKVPYYFYLDITQVDGDRIITAPIWIIKKTKKDSTKNSPGSNNRPDLKPITHVLPVTLFSGLQQTLTKLSVKCKPVFGQQPGTWFLEFLLLGALLIGLMIRYSSFLMDHNRYSLPIYHLSCWIAMVSAAGCSGALCNFRWNIDYITCALLAAGSILVVLDKMVSSSKYGNSQSRSSEIIVPSRFLQHLLAENRNLRLYRLQAFFVHGLLGLWYILKFYVELQTGSSKPELFVLDIGYWSFFTLLVSWIIYILGRWIGGQDIDTDNFGGGNIVDPEISLELLQYAHS